jgi:hypothetical protein
MGMVKALVVMGTILSLGFLVLIVAVARLHWMKLAHALVPAACSSAVAIAIAAVFDFWTPQIPAPYFVLPAGLVVAILVVYALFFGQFKAWGASLAARKQPEPVTA